MSQKKEKEDGEIMGTADRSSVEGAADTAELGHDDGGTISETVKEKKKSAKEQLKEELTAANDRMLRIMAEYENYRKRTEKEKQTLVSFGTAIAVERLLPVLDTLEAAAATKSGDPEYKKGVELTAAMFATKLNSLGVSEIEAEGAKFDPNMHDCVASEESDKYESGVVIRVMQKGYVFNERVIRPAMVAVSV